jgi:hypothetical protein
MLKTRPAIGERTAASPLVAPVGADAADAGGATDWDLLGDGTTATAALESDFSSTS